MWLRGDRQPGYIEHGKRTHVTLRRDRELRRLPSVELVISGVLAGDLRSKIKTRV